METRPYESQVTCRLVENDEEFYYIISRGGRAILIPLDIEWASEDAREVSYEIENLIRGHERR